MNVARGLSIGETDDIEEDISVLESLFSLKQFKNAIGLMTTIL
jgi:hypothetical protein